VDLVPADIVKLTLTSRKCDRSCNKWVKAIFRGCQNCVCGRQNAATAGNSPSQAGWRGYAGAGNKKKEKSEKKRKGFGL